MALKPCELFHRVYWGCAFSPGLENIRNVSQIGKLLAIGLLFQQPL